MFFDCDNIREQKSGQIGKYHVNVYFSKSYLISGKARTFNSFCNLLISVNKSAQFRGEFRQGCSVQDFSRIYEVGRLGRKRNGYFLSHIFYNISQELTELPRRIGQKFRG